MMSLNITLGSLIYISFASLDFMAAAITLYQFRKHKYIHALFHALGWIFVGLWTLFWGLANLFLSPHLLIVGNICLVALLFCMAFFMDSIMNERITTPTMLVSSVVGAAAIFTSFDPNGITQFVFPNGELEIIPAGMSVISLVLLISVACGYYFYCMLKILLNSPPNLKKFSIINFLGGVWCVMPVVFVFSTLAWVIPGILSISMAIGAILCTISWAFEPKLGFVLPFKAQRLSIIQTASGNSLFTHIWAIKSKNVDDTMFSGMLTTISSFIEETLESGIVHEIHLKKAILILRRSKTHPIISVLVTDRSTRTLRDAFYSFADQFFEKFAKEGSLEGVDVEKFKEAAKLVENNFPFVPEYD